jgi:hypothetical protein
MFVIFNKDFSNPIDIIRRISQALHLDRSCPTRTTHLKARIWNQNIDPALFDLQSQPIPPTQALPSISNEPESATSQSTVTPAQSTKPMLTFGPSWLPVPPSHQLFTPSPTISPSPVLSRPIPLLLEHPIQISVRWNIPIPVPPAVTDKDLNSSFNESLSSCHSELITITKVPTLSSLCFDMATAFDLDNVPTFAPESDSATTKQYVIQVLRLKALKEKKWTTMLIREKNFEEDIVPLLHILAKSGVTVEEGERIMFLEFGAGVRELAPPKRYVSPYGSAMDVDG